MSSNSLFASPRGHQSAGGSSSSSVLAHTTTASSSSSSLAENHDTQIISPFQQQQQQTNNNAEPFNNGTSQRDEHGMITTPPLLKRRAYSYDLGGHAVAVAVAGGQFSMGAGGGGSASGNTNRDDDTKDMNIHGLRTIPSRCEMDDDELLNNDNYNTMEVTRRHTLYATPTRRRGRGTNYNYHSSRQQQHQHQQRHHPNNNRSRSVSSDVILNCLPRYDNELAARIATISNDQVEVDNMAAIQQPAPQRGEQSFFTPERRPATAAAATRLYLNRDRANTCPHRPQRHSIFFHQQNDSDNDEQHHGTNGNGGLEFGEGDEESGPLTTTLNDPMDNDNGHLDGSSEYETPELTSPSRLVASTNNQTTPERQRSFGRRASPAVPLLNLSSSLLSPSSVATPSSARRATRPSPLVSPTSSSSTLTSAVVIPNSPQVTTTTNTNTTSRTPLASRTPSSSQQQPLSPTITTPLQQDQNNCIHRINPHLMKFLMILSLYILLAYTWNTDFSQRYKSMEINYGLSEYWHGEVLLSSQSDNNNHNKGVGIMGGKHSRGDKLFVDDANNIGVGAVDDNIAKLLINGEDSGDDTTTITNSGSKDDDVTTAHAHTNTATLVSSLEDKNNSNNKNNKKQQRPYLSYARSSGAISDTYHPAYGISNIKRRAAYTTTTKSNSKFQWVWALVWMAFMIPIVEAGIREVRRQVNIRFWNVRRLRSFRAMPTNHRGGHNVHNL